MTWFGGKGLEAAIALGLLGMAAILSISAGIYTSQSARALELSIMCITVGVLLATMIACRSDIASCEELRLFHPLILPLGYMAYVLLGPSIYMLTTGQGIGTIPGDTLSVPLLSIMSVFILSFTIGALVVQLLGRHKQNQDDLPPCKISRIVEGEDPTGATLIGSGRVVLVAALGLKLVQVALAGTVFSNQYGENQLEYSYITALGIAGELCVVAGALLVMWGNTRAGRQPLVKFDFVLLIVPLAVSAVLLGSRGELIPPLLMFVWFRSRAGRPIRVWQLAAGLLVVVAVFLSVWLLRGTSTNGESYSLIEQILWQTASVHLVTSNVAGLIPGDDGFYLGSTYVAALLLALPGFISRAIFGEVSGTGAFAYRELIQYENPNQGFGFAITAEAYLNFGLAGVTAIGLLMGAFFAVVFRLASKRYDFSSLLYPLALGTLPYALRSDFLTQYKGFLYPLIICALVAFLSRYAVVRSLVGRVGGDYRWLSRDASRNSSV